MEAREGSVSELLATGLCILAMTAVMMSYMGSVGLIQQKMAVSQLARKYILRMETVGYLTENDQVSLQQELIEQGVTDISLDGSTMHVTMYGEPITLHIRGRLKEHYDFEEQRVSTAKN